MEKEKQKPKLNRRQIGELSTERGKRKAKVKNRESWKSISTPPLSPVGFLYDSATGHSSSTS